MLDVRFKTGDMRMELPPGSIKLRVPNSNLLPATGNL